MLKYIIPVALSMQVLAAEPTLSEKTAQVGKEVKETAVDSAKVTGKAMKKGYEATKEGAKKGYEATKEKGEEMKAKFKDTFMSSDSDKSGGLNQSEFAAFNAKMKEEMQKNKLSDEEMFKKLDTNNDGQISEKEFHAGNHHKHCDADCKGKK